MESLSPFVQVFLLLIVGTSFVKILTSLSILRFGLGLDGAGFGLVVIGASLALSLAVMDPVLNSVGGSEAILTGEIQFSKDSLEKTLSPFLSKHADAQLQDRFSQIVPQENEGQKEPSFSVLIASFVVTEIREAFQVGVIILVPFLVIDLLVVNVLLSLGVTGLSEALVAVPLKLLLFFAVDGWALISQKLLNSYI